MIMHTIRNGESAGLHFKLNMLYRETVVEFYLETEDRNERFRFTIPFAHLDSINRVNTSNASKVELLLSVPTPPRFYRKLDEKDTHDSKSRYWTERDAWYRQTDITYSPAMLRSSPVALKKQSPIIDIGK